MSLETLILPKKFETYLLLGMLDQVVLAPSSSQANFIRFVRRLRVSQHVVFWEDKIFYQLPHVPVSLIPSIDPLPGLFPKESPTSLFESPPSITDVPSHASNKLPATIIDMPTDTAPTVDPAGPSDSHALHHSHQVTTLPSHLRDFHCFSSLASL